MVSSLFGNLHVPYDAEPTAWSEVSRAARIGLAHLPDADRRNEDDTMAATLTVLRDTSARSVREMMQNIGQRARDASDILADASSGAKNHALRAAARLIRERASHITDANDLDIKQAETLGLTNAAKDKLKLNQKRIEAMARGLEEISELPDPVGEVLASWERPNGLNINRISIIRGEAVHFILYF